MIDIDNPVGDLSVLIAVVTGLTAMTNRFGLPEKFEPVLALVLGVIFAFFYVDVSVRYQILSGLIIGLSSSGLYKNSKSVYGKVKEKRTGSSS